MDGGVAKITLYNKGQIKNVDMKARAERMHIQPGTNAQHPVGSLFLDIAMVPSSCGSVCAGLEIPGWEGQFGVLPDEFPGESCPWPCIL